MLLLTRSDRATASSPCAAREVSKARFYDWCERRHRPSADALALQTAARAAHERGGRQTYGPKRLRTELAEAGFALSLVAVKRLRKRLGLRCKQNRKYQATTDSQHTLPVAPNLLDRQFAQGAAPNQAWVADITYIATDEGWLYLGEGPQAPARIDRSFRSWQSIRQRGLSPLVNAVWHAAIDASQG